MRERINIKGSAGLMDLVKLFNLAKSWVLNGHEIYAEIRHSTRTLAQNSIMWSILDDLSRQTKWAVDGEMVQLEAEEIKDILTAYLRKHQRMAKGIDGGLVILGMRTSKMTKQDISDVIEAGYAVGAERGVRWKRTSLGRDVPNEVIDTTAREVQEPKRLEHAHA